MSGLPNPLDVLRLIAGEQRANLPAIEPTRFADAFKVGANVPISGELVDDASGNHTSFITATFEDSVRDMLKQTADRARLLATGLEPMDYRPGRAEWWDVTRPDRVRRNIRANLGMRPGQIAHMVRSADQGR